MPSQTSVAGTPGAPYVVSASVSGPHSGGPDLRPATHAALGVLQRIRAAHAERGWSSHDAWTFMRVTPGQQRDNKVWRSGKIPHGHWDESVAGVPDTYDTVDLEAPSWGGLRLQAPTLLRPGAPWRDVRLWLSSPTEGLVQATDTLVEWLVESLATPGVTHGFVHVDGLADPYGTVVVEHSLFPGADLAGRVEGYYWCLALGEAQVASVGGPEGMLSTGLCDTVTAIDVGGRPGLLCRLTEDPADLTEDRVRAWRDHLLPLLRPGIPGRLDDLDRGGSLSRPLWLYEGPPAPADAPSILVHGAPPAPLTLSVEAPESAVTSLDCELTVTSVTERDVAVAVAGAVGAWCRSIAAGALVGDPRPVEVTSSPVAAEGDTLRWRLDAAAPVSPAAVSLLVAVLQSLHDQLNWPHAAHEPGPQLLRLALREG
jgi:hypothetical protein